MKSILLFDTSVATFNTGDEIIMESIKKNWPEIYGNNYVRTFPAHTPSFRLWQFLLKKSCHEYAKADLKFICGTNVLYTNMFRPNPVWNVFYGNTSIQEGTVCIGTGVGVNSTKTTAYTKMLFRKVLSHKYIHSVRDEKTKKYLEDMGLRACNTGCPTLWGLTPEFCQSIPTKKTNSVVFTLTGYQPDIENDRAMIEILKSHYDNVYFWPQSWGDISYMKSVCDSTDIKIVSPNLKGFDEILSKDIDYVGNRLHGGIFAMQHRCRSIIIAIDYRATEMANSYSIKCIQRKKIKEQLSDLIGSEWNTMITGLNFEKIEAWKRQFEL